MSQKKTEAPPETVAMVSANGWTANPLKSDEEVWLAAGWKRAETKSVKEKPHG